MAVAALPDCQHACLPPLANAVHVAAPHTLCLLHLQAATQTNPDLINTGTPMMEHEQEKKRMGKPFPYMRPGHKADSSPVPNFHGMPVRVQSRACISRPEDASTRERQCWCSSVASCAGAMFSNGFEVDSLTHRTVDK